MEVIRQRRPLSGTITIQKQARPTGQREHQPQAGGTRKHPLYIWRPSQEIAADLPPDFCLRFQCVNAADGFRCFVPAGAFGAFLIEAALGGSVLLAHRLGLSSEQRSHFRVMRLIFQLGAHLREHFSRSFKKEKDLYLAKSSRMGDTHILPEDLGLDRQGQGQPWRPSELMERGRDAAVAAGIANPDPENCIRFGLLEAARRNPLVLEDVSETEALQLVRLGLFDLGPTTIDEGQMEVFQERFLGALERHIDDDTETFNRWFMGQIDNIVHQIVKKKRPGGALSRDVVRQALLEMVFRAYRYVGDSVHVQMAHFLRALPEKLTPEEEAWFKLIYQKQPALGGLPLILVHKRFDFLCGAIFDMWKNPHDEWRLGVLLRLLHYYGIMVSKRREVDRRYKAERPSRAESLPRHRFRASEQGQEPATEESVDLFADIAAQVRELKQLGCNCRRTSEWRAVLIHDTLTEVVWRDVCNRCGHTKTVRVSRDQFRQIGEELMKG